VSPVSEIIEILKCWKIAGLGYASRMTSQPSVTQLTAGVTSATNACRHRGIEARQTCDWWRWVGPIPPNDELSD
jgi:hypothetical protein